MKTFTISDTEEQTLLSWLKKIKKKHGEYGGYIYSFTPTGIGDVCRVYSELTKETKDITDYNSW